MQETLVQFLGQEDSRKRDRLPTSVFVGFTGDSDGKESTCNAGDLDSIPGLGRSPGEVKGYPLQYSGLENSMDYTVHGVAKNWTQLSNFPERAMAPYSSTLAWKIPWMEEPGGLQSMGSLRVGHD